MISDVKKIKIEDLPRLSDDIAKLIKDVVKTHGGHYSSPLGVVDLTVALHYIYISPNRI